MFGFGKKFVDDRVEMLKEAVSYDETTSKQDNKNKGK